MALARPLCNAANVVLHCNKKESHDETATTRPGDGGATPGFSVWGCSRARQRGTQKSRRVGQTQDDIENREVALPHGFGATRVRIRQNPGYRRRRGLRRLTTQPCRRGACTRT